MLVHIINRSLNKLFYRELLKNLEPGLNRKVGSINNNAIIRRFHYFNEYSFTGWPKTLICCEYVIILMRQTLHQVFLTLHKQVFIDWHQEQARHVSSFENISCCTDRFTTSVWCFFLFAWLLAVTWGKSQIGYLCRQPETILLMKCLISKTFHGISSNEIEATFENFLKRFDWFIPP